MTGMLTTRKALVKQVEALDESTLCVRIEVEGEEATAYCYRSMCDVEVGDEVLVNVTARKLNLGTGGVDFIICNLSRPEVNISGPGHIIKLRYTPMQFAVLTEEEHNPDALGSFDSLNGMPVVAAFLHSQIAPIAAGVKSVNPNARVVYVMTEGAALPMGFSSLVRDLKGCGFVSETISCGQAFGGDREAVNLYSALAIAQTVCKADVAIVCQGPGNVGTGTSLGFSAASVGQVINATHGLGGRSVTAVRMSQADPRERHRLISHHCLTVLERFALAASLVSLPEMPDELMEQAHIQLQSLKLFEHHEIRHFDGKPGMTLLEQRGMRIRSMGRSFEDDPYFFLAASAAGRCAGEMLSPNFPG